MYMKYSFVVKPIKEVTMYMKYLQTCTSCTLSSLFYVSLHRAVLHVHCHLFFMFHYKEHCVVKHKKEVTMYMKYSFVVKHKKEVTMYMKYSTV
jgi:hypothetical protein